MSTAHVYIDWEIGQQTPDLARSRLTSDEKTNPIFAKSVFAFLKRVCLHKDLNVECQRLAEIPESAFVGPVNPFPPSRYNRQII